MNERTLVQYVACLQTHFEIPSDWSWLLENMPEALKSRISLWEAAFRQDIIGSRAGYPIVSAREAPDLEDEMLAIAVDAGWVTQWQPKQSQPTLCLSHDIDYLKPTLQMRLKRLISQKKWTQTHDTYLESIETLLKADTQVGGRGQSTVFMAAPKRVNSPKTWLTQWLIDPSYALTSPLFQNALRLIQAYGCDIGIHGSFFSLQNQLLQAECRSLGHAVKQPIAIARQHWLNLPGTDALDRMYQAGISIDSTLGWNGAVGFRGGISRPFPIFLKTGTLWEVPLVLMDGPMFDDLGLTTAGVVKKAKQLLSEVLDRRGCVAINWHDRAAHPDYGWFDAYQEILSWAKSVGFQFKTIAQAAKETAYA